MNNVVYGNEVYTGLGFMLEASLSQSHAEFLSVCVR